MEWDVGVTSRGQALTRVLKGDVKVAVGSAGQAGAGASGSEQVGRTHATAATG